MIVIDSATHASAQAKHAHIKQPSNEPLQHHYMQCHCYVAPTAYVICRPPMVHVALEVTKK